MCNWPWTFFPIMNGSWKCKGAFNLRNTRVVNDLKVWFCEFFFCCLTKLPYSWIFKVDSEEIVFSFFFFFLFCCCFFSVFDSYVNAGITYFKGQVMKHLNTIKLNWLKWCKSFECPVLFILIRFNINKGMLKLWTKSDSICTDHLVVSHTWL